MSTAAVPDASDEDVTVDITVDEEDETSAAAAEQDDDQDDDAAAATPFAQLFATETMAELSARQGRTADAIAIYRHLLGGLGAGVADDERRLRWTDRLTALNQAPAAAAGRARHKSPPARTAGAVLPRAATPSTRANAATSRPAAASPDATSSALSKPTDSALAAAPADSAPAASTPHRLPMVIRQPVRSGQIVYAEKGDLIVMAPVNPGAQVIADGNIHIYGTLRGRAVAGVRGAADAQVFCLALEAELVGVDVGYVPSAEIPADRWGQPSRVFLRDGLCVIEPLLPPSPQATVLSRPARSAPAGGGWPWRKKRG